MGFFNFIETFFFISLGITFVLILLLVYHFKQRMNNLEQKCDTMFEIINNIVKELTILRNTQSTQPMFYGAFPSNMNEIYQRMENTEEKLVVSDEDTSGSEYDTNDDEDGEGEESDGEGEESDGEGEESDDVEPEQKTIKIVNVNISDTIDVEEIANFEQPEETEYADEDNNGIEPIEMDDIHVEKLNHIEPEPELIVADDIDDSTSITSTNKDVYKKMTLVALKTVAITKGLCSDASKLKKTDLLKLLEESE